MSDFVLVLVLVLDAVVLFSISRTRTIGAPLILRHKDEVSYEHRLWPQAASLIVEETLKFHIRCQGTKGMGHGAWRMELNICNANSVIILRRYELYARIYALCQKPATSDQ